MIAALPARHHGVPPPGWPGVPVPPAPMPGWRYGRPLKAWRWVGAFCEEWMLCAADVRLGPARSTFWALWDRERAVLHERTHALRHGAVELAPGTARIRDAGVEVELAFGEELERAVESCAEHGRGYVWTRKQGGVEVEGEVRLPGGPRRSAHALGVIDETAGYHARHTEWWWAAGVGSARDGTPLAFNLVQGIGDPAVDSERTVWLDGVPAELGPVAFAPLLGTVGALSFQGEAERRRREQRLLVRSEIRQPFGVFSGRLPGGVEVARALGVTEHHRARW
jgi:hypothetical protein